MPIKAIRLRAGFLLLLFTLMFISSNFLIIEIHADTLEEPFKNTPLPFWEINNENCLTQYGTNTQDILFSYGEYLEDFNDVSDWGLSLNEVDESITTNNGIGTFLAKGGAVNDRDNIYTNSPSINSWGYIEIRYKMNSIASFTWNMYILDVDTKYTDEGRINFYLTETITWRTDKFHVTNYDGLLQEYDGSLETIIIQGRNNDGINVEINIAYIHVWKDYQEDMSDISDWVYHASLGLAGGEYGFITDGDIGNLWIITDDYSNEQVHYKMAMNYLITSKTRFEIKSKVETSLITLGTRLTGNNLNIWPSSCANTNWLIQNPDISGSAGKIIDWLYIYNDDNPDDGFPWGNYSAYFDYINIWEEGGTLNVSISVEQFKNHKFEFMVDTDDLDNTTKLEFGIFQDYDSMNYDFSLENQTFEQRDFSFNYSGYNYLRFKIELKYSINSYKLTCTDENNSKLFDNLIFEYVRKTGNQFIISSLNFTRWFHLYYFTGSIDYASEWNRDISDEDSEVYQTDYSAELATTTTALSHSSTRNIFVAGFQYWRSEYLIDFDLSGYGSGDTFEIFLNATLEFYYPDGSLQYSVFADMGKTLDFGVSTSRWGRIKVYHYENDVGSLVYDAPAGAHMTSEIAGTQNGKFAVWRTQENHLGIKYLGAEWASPYLEEDVFTTWISEFTLENFQCNITQEFSIIYDGFTDVGIILSFNALEYSYNQLLGVSEPHFSTTWWDSIPIIGPIINAILLMMLAVSTAIEAGFAPISAIIDSAIGTVVSAIGGLASSIWILFESSLDSIGISIDAMASDIWSFFSSAISGIADGIDNVLSALGDIFTSIEALATLMEIIDTVIDNISTGISSLITGLNDLTGLITTISGFVSSINTVIDTVSTIVSNVLTALTDLATVIDIFYGAFVSVATVIDTVSAIVNNVYTTLQNIATNFSTWVATGITNALVPAIIAGLEDMIDYLLTLWEYQLNLFGNALGWGDIGTFLFDLTGSVVLIVPSWLTFIIGIMSFLVSILVWVNLMWVRYGAMIITMGTLFVALDFTRALLTMDDEIIVECVGKYLNVLEKILTFTYNIVSVVLSAIWGILPF